MAHLSQADINQYMQLNKKNFDNLQIENVRALLANSDVTMEELNTVKYKSPTTGKILSFTLGFLGIDRFYTGNFILGFLKLCTGGFGGIWWVIDWFLIDKSIKQNNLGMLYSFLKGETFSVTANTINTAKTLAQSKELRKSVKDIGKSFKDLMDSMDIES